MRSLFPYAWSLAAALTTGALAAAPARAQPVPQEAGESDRDGRQDGRSQGQGTFTEEGPPVLARPPRIKKIVPAELPPATSFPEGSEAVEVVLELKVSPKGRVTEARVKRGAGAPFDEAARRAALQMELEPALLSSGQAVAVAIDFRMRIARPTPPEQPVLAAPAAPSPVLFSGQLLQRGTRRPLAGVEVSARAKGLVLARAVTDADGRFALSVAASRFDISALPEGHQVLQVQVSAQPGERREERFFLESAETGFVTEVRSQRVRREVTRQVLPKALVERVPGTAGDTLKVVQILPGVSRASFDGGLLVLRGASPGDSRIFLEGQEIPVLFHFGGLRSSFGSVFLQAVEFVPGNFGPEFGRATGGVIEIKVRDPARDLFRGQVDLNLYDAGLALEGPISKNWSVGGAFRRSWVDAILPAVLPDDVPLTFDTVPRFYDYQMLATWKPSARRRLRFIFYGSMDKLVALLDRPLDDPALRGTLDARVMFHNLYAGYSSRLSSRVTQETSLQLGYQELSTSVGPELFFNLEVLRLSGRTTWAYELSSLLSLRAGLDMRVDGVQIDLNSPDRPLEGESVPPTSTRKFFGVSKSTTLYNPAVFIEGRLTPSEALSLLLSLRLDWYREIGALTVDPRLVVRYRLPSDTTLKAGFGSYHQGPAPDQSDDETGNPALDPPSSLHLSLGAEQRLADSIQIELTGFYKWLDQQVIRNPYFFYNPGAPPYLSWGTGRIFGLELLVRARLGSRFQGWLAYTFQRSFRQDGPDSAERLFDFDQPHILTAVGTVRIGAGWSAGLRFRLVSGSPYTPVVGSVYDATSDTYVPLFGASNSERRDIFHQLDLRVDKTFTFKT